MAVIFLVIAREILTKCAFAQKTRGTCLNMMCNQMNVTKIIISCYSVLIHSILISSQVKLVKQEKSKICPMKWNSFLGEL